MVPSHVGNKACEDDGRLFLNTIKLDKSEAAVGVPVQLCW